LLYNRTLTDYDAGALLMNGFPDNKVRDYEIRHRAVAREAASEGMVLLKNTGRLLPLKTGSKVALFGAGASKTVKGGTGSGDVNERESVTIWQGMVNAGFQITDEEWLRGYDRKFDRARTEWRDQIISRLTSLDTMEFFEVYSSIPFHYPSGEPVCKTDTDTAFYIISRIAGENADRHAEKGDYLLTDDEKADIKNLCDYYQNVIIVINAGGLIDLSETDVYPQIKSILMIVQPGMEGGNAFADIVSGKVTPSGKLTDSWPLKYEDFPNAGTFSFNSGSTWTEEYREGIYVGYRYFDTFQIPVKYGFGFGLSFTTFSISYRGVSISCPESKGHVQYGTGNHCTEPVIHVEVSVKNTGEEYSGKEVVEIYASLPCGRLEKEYRRLVGFQKTNLLKPGESEILTITVPMYFLSSFDEFLPGYLLEKGSYGIWIGSSLESAKPEQILKLEKDAVLVRSENILKKKQSLAELKQDADQCAERYRAWSGRKLPVMELDADRLQTETYVYGRSNTLASDKAQKIAGNLTEDQLISLVIGNPAHGQNAAIGSAGITVPGAAGETGSCKTGDSIPAMVLADGPAGLRLVNTFYVENGEPVQQEFYCSVEHGIFTEAIPRAKGISKKSAGEKRYQYCTAFPVGTLLAQSWNVELLKKTGEAVAEEMRLFHIKLWLAPGMNIHRNPLCGRNFEYYSEDPLLTGFMAAAITEGVQKQAGTGTTIKHFAGNNQEDNRMGSDDIVSERALREIYLKGFEIAVKMSQPSAIMTSYNLINGVHSANSYDLCTKAARNEWGFRGLIMTDWTTTTGSTDEKGCTAAGCIRAGNDLIMPGAAEDFADVRKALKEGTLSAEELKDCAARIIELALNN
jgi:beta-glucosidase